MNNISKTRRKSINVLAIVAVLILSLSMALTACGKKSSPSQTESSVEETVQLFAGGSGTASDPYQVATADQLNNVREDLEANYVLIADIDLSGFENWQPIGVFQSKSDAPEDVEIPKEEVAFRGTFDGNGHTISNLTIDEPQSMAVGLFGCATGSADTKGFIRNLTLENVNVTGMFLVGGAVGLQFMNFEVENIILSGTNTLCGMQGVGGIVGTGFDWIRNCTASADINILGDDGACAGLIAGGTTFSSIEKCIAKEGTITANGNVCWGFGGICGAPYAAAEISSCEVMNVTLNIMGENSRLVGGIAGFAGTYAEGSAAEISDCKVQGVNISVSDTTTCVGGILGGPKEESEGSDAMSHYLVNGCSVSGTITGGKENIGNVVGDETNAEKLNCTGEMTIR